MAAKKQQKLHGDKPASLKTLAEHLGLSPATISVVLNDVPGRSIPQVTRDRIKAAAKKLNYQPSLLARSLRNRRTHTIGILVPELGEGYHTQVLSGVGDQLVQEGYFYFTAHHRHKPELVEQYARLLVGRGAEGLIFVDTALQHNYPVPAVAVAAHRHIDGVTNVMLDQGKADVAFIWGPVAGYYAARQRERLALSFVSPAVDRSGIPFVFSIAAGVHNGCIWPTTALDVTHTAAVR